MDATELVTEVPEPLKKLMKFILRAFYTTEEMLIMDLLLRNACMKEEDVAELLKLDKKQMGVAIKRLKNDQFIKPRMKVAVDSDGKTTKHNYYFIHYTGFVNVVKYKLDHVRRKLEVQERDSTSRASFKCTNCLKTYTDLEADHLFDMDRQTFNCMMCGCEMEEEQTAAPVKDARALVAKFNEQIEPLFNLLRECEKYKLSVTILEPAPMELSQLLGKKSASDKTPANKTTNPDGPRTWSGDATKNIEFGLQSNTIDVKLGNDTTENRTNRVKKEQPAWMTKSTIDGLDTAFFPSTQANQNQSTTENSTSSTTDNSIMQTLLVHENKPVAPVVNSLNIPSAAERSDESDMEELPAPSVSAERMNDSDGEEEEVMVAVGDRSVPFHQAADMVDQMTDEQRETYNRIAQSLFADMEFF